MFHGCPFCDMGELSELGGYSKFMTLFNADKVLTLPLSILIRLVLTFHVQTIPLTVFHVLS